jgi:phospholipid-binding lipoprotein MlaA
MKLTGLSLRIAFILFFLTLFLPAVTLESNYHYQLRFHAANGVFAAENDDFEEPFAEETNVVVHDPHQSMNRTFFNLNDKIYFWVLKPVAQVYSTFIPEGVRICIRNGFRNIAFPIRFFNNAFQGKFDRAGVEFGRFVVNSTLGMGGFFEIASRDFNLNPYDEDFGQTLAVYGMGPGPHIHWPFFGPSNIRDTFGLIGDFALNPTTYISLIESDFLVTGGIKAGRITNNVSLRIGEYEDIKRSALDPYVAIRDAYHQHREDEIKK